MFHLHWKKKRIHESSMRRLFILHLFTVVKFVYYRAFVKISIFEEFDSWSGGVILIKLDSNRRFFWPLNVMDDLENNRTPLLNYVKLFASFQSHRWIGSGEYAYFPPQPPGSLMSWGTVAKNVTGLYKTNTFYEQLHQIPWYKMKSTIFPHKFRRPSWITLVFRPKYVWFLIHIDIV